MDIERYYSQIVIDEIGKEGQYKILHAKVLVIGAGGLGCPVLSYLAAAGIGEIGIVDFDKVEKKNLQRQILYNENDIGEYKTLVAQKKIQAQNSSIIVNSYCSQLNLENAREIIGRYDIIVDCCDNIETRLLINQTCIDTGKPFVYGAVSKFEGQISVCNYNGGITFSDIFPDKKVFDHENDCSINGIMGFCTGIIGSMQASEVIKMILGIETVLNHEVCTIDLLSMNFRKLRIKKR